MKKYRLYLNPPHKQTVLDRRWEHLFKNIDRINTELKISETNHHNFKNFPFYWVKKTEFNKTYTKSTTKIRIFPLEIK